MMMMTTATMMMIMMTSTIDLPRLPTHLIVKMEKGNNDNDWDAGDDDDSDDDDYEVHLVEGGLKGRCSGLTTAVHLRHFFIRNQEKDGNDYL